MNDLVIMKSKQALTTSLKVAEKFKKNHKDVMKSIRNLTAQNCAVKNMFVESTYVNSRGQEQPMYYMNRDGFTLLAMGFTGKEAVKFKLEYIEAFNKMENFIREQELPRTPEEKLALTMEAAIHLDKRVSKIEDDVDYLKNNQEIDSGQRFELEKARKIKAMQVVGGPESNYYQEKRARKVFAKISKNFHDAFHISRYEDLKRKDFQRALDYIKNWYPDYDLKNEIDERNAQTKLNLL